MTIKITLPEAVQEAIDFFVRREVEFSIFDITRSIRDDVNINKYEVTHHETGTIYHNDVKEVFENLLKDSDLLEFVEYRSSNHDGRYGVYRKSNSYKTSDKNFNEALCKQIDRVLEVLDGDDDELIPNDRGDGFEDSFKVVEDILTEAEAVKDYIQNKGVVTLKQIQSRLKTKGITCQNILNKLCSLSDVKVTPDKDGHISKYKAQVK